MTDLINIFFILCEGSQQKYGRAQFQTDRRKDEVHCGAEALREDFVDSRVQPTAPFVYDTDTIKILRQVH